MRVLTVSYLLMEKWVLFYFNPFYETVNYYYLCLKVWKATDIVSCGLPLHFLWMWHVNTNLRFVFIPFLTAAGVCISGSWLVVQVQWKHQRLVQHWRTQLECFCYRLVQKLLVQFLPRTQKVTAGFRATLETQRKLRGFETNHQTSRKTLICWLKDYLSEILMCTCINVRITKLLFCFYSDMICL